MKKKRQLFILSVFTWIALGILILLMEPLLGILFMLIGALLFLFFTIRYRAVWNAQKAAMGNRVSGMFSDRQEESGDPVHHYALVMIRPDSGRRYPIKDNVFVIGRKIGCDCMLNNAEVSRTHCRIVYREHSREYYLEDMRSHNGTYIGTRRLEPFAPVRLLENVDINIGSYCLRFVRDDR